MNRVINNSPAIMKAADMVNVRPAAINARAALEMMGIAFCDHCGEPHRIRPGRITAMTLRREEGDSVAVCMDDAAYCGCFFGALSKKDKSIGEPSTPVKYRDLSGSIARWILESHAYEPHNEMHGAVTDAIILGVKGASTEEIAFSLLYWRHAGLGGVIAGETGRELLAMCGWEPSDEEYCALIKQCRDFAVTHRHHAQLAFFTEIAKGL